MGRIVVTDLYNHAMPIIRYDTGDVGVISYESKCKTKGKVFTRVDGRRIDCIYSTKGEMLSPYIVNNTLWRFEELKQYQFIQNAVPGCRISGAQPLFTELRLRKTEEELDCMRKAAIIAQDALEETLKLVKPGVTERELGSELVAQMLRMGSDPKLPFDPIVGSGPNSANPHAEVSDRQLQRGDFLLFDWGARWKGYCSDITRTFVVGEASDKQIEIYNTVLAANRAALAAVRPGVTAGSIDDAGRAVINAKGYGQYFTHRIGHGLGLEEHEEPYMFAGNPVILEPGMCFSDEPGIYLPDWGGVRIEDDITVTADAGRSISDFPRELRIL